MVAQRVMEMVVAAVVLAAVAVKAASEPSDEEIVNKCGFSLQAIHGPVLIAAATPLAPRSVCCRPHSKPGGS
ncbi:unnamed protein product [Lampetra planeri]